MLAPAAGKAMTGRQLDNPLLHTEARVTLIDGYLAGAILTGLALNAALGWVVGGPTRETRHRPLRTARRQPRALRA
jgi:hypothetical protein